ncbi:MAG: 50S ribosomal protein L18 [Melioribacteraceae bacterium]|nr:50S ribosomal protein L18 [Melioribacteraceae bacterium]MCF8354680.1 50S ribosomal protein L18 [Melioribacteraceae bacterium]MCF8393582.1 50S ribosomal protein L18 [Melioribacteraceae bacterium]MCF8419392.1 50S ribosomal protein L18 [Melioribacteraceae bacterium]
MIKKDYYRQARKRVRIRKKISGTTEKPRLSVSRSLIQIYAQLIDDSQGKTVAAASSLSKEIADEIKNAKTKVEKSKIVGTLIAKKAIDAGFTNVVFDRSGYRYHGRIKALAEGAREGGLKF